MSFTGAFAAIGTHLNAAGNAIDRPVEVVFTGDPGVPTAKLIAYWYAGDGDPVHFPPRTLTDQMVGIQVTVQAYWPVATRDKNASANLEADVQALNYQIKSRLLGDSTLGGECKDLAISDTSTGWLAPDGGLYRTLTMTVTLDFVDLYTIAP